MNSNQHCGQNEAPFLFPDSFDGVKFDQTPYPNVTFPVSVNTIDDGKRDVIRDIPWFGGCNEWQSPILEQTNWSFVARDKSGTPIVTAGVSFVMIPIHLSGSKGTV